MVSRNTSSLESIIEQFVCFLNVLVSTADMLEDDFSEDALVLRYLMEQFSQLVILESPYSIHLIDDKLAIAVAANILSGKFSAQV